MLGGSWLQALRLVQLISDDKVEGGSCYQAWAGTDLNLAVIFAITEVTPASTISEIEPDMEVLTDMA